jgi:hypothetical protein
MQLATDLQCPHTSVSGGAAKALILAATQAGAPVGAHTNPCSVHLMTSASDAKRALRVSDFCGLFGMSQGTLAQSRRTKQNIEQRSDALVLAKCVADRVAFRLGVLRNTARITEPRLLVAWSFRQERHVDLDASPPPVLAA